MRHRTTSAKLGTRRSINGSINQGPTPCCFSTTEGEPELYPRKGSSSHSIPLQGDNLHTYLYLYTGAMTRDLHSGSNTQMVWTSTHDNKGSIQQVSHHHHKRRTMPYHHYAYISSCLVSDQAYCMTYKTHAMAT